MELRPYLFYLFFCLLYFSYRLSKTMGCFSGCPMSSASIQKLFCGFSSAFKCSFDAFVGEKVVSPSYSSAIFRVCLCLFLISFSYIFMFVMVWVENLFSHSVVSDSATPWTAPSQASLSFPISQRLLKLMSVELVVSSNRLILCYLLLFLPLIFLTIRVFKNYICW